MQASLRASSPGGAGMREGKGEDLIGEILTTQHQMSHRGFWGWKVYHVTDIKLTKKILIVCFFFWYGLMPACRLGMHALQEKNKRHKPGLGHVL